ncbi:Rhodanese-like protein [Cristinia sonorae]|uniref:Rhodanese-like protein n=1 Tax=Cristinia sonorae TaxID=1940300 RepID=A0A8K0UNJ0_9AGAR|nr:Rhodanese-like protein [Cristinia sonorae]
MSIYGDNCPLVLSPRQVDDLHSDTGVAILDASWFMPNSPRRPREEFLQKRIHGARFLDLDEVASPHDLGLKHMMPDPETFAKACENFGISPSSHVVIYDTHGVFSSPRALFMFRSFGHHRSSILNGGLPAWEAHGCPVESGESLPPAKGVYPPPKLDETVIRGYEQMVANSNLDPAGEPSAEIVIDARPQGRYHGSDPEPRPGLSSGHIPHSLSLPFTTFLDTHTVERSDGSTGTYTTLRTAAGIHEGLLSALGPEYTKEVLSGKRSIVASCGSGMTAGVLWLGLKTLGVDNVGLYDESWTGYASRKDSPILKTL